MSLRSKLFALTYDRQMAKVEKAAAALHRARPRRRSPARPPPGPHELDNQLVMRCDCNRPTLTSIEEAGFTVTRVEHLTMPIGFVTGQKA